MADPSAHHGHDQIFFGATVTYANSKGEERTITIKGIDEADNLHGEVSWVSPIARGSKRRPERLKRHEQKTADTIAELSEERDRLLERLFDDIDSGETRPANGSRRP